MGTLNCDRSSGRSRIGTGDIMGGDSVTDCDRSSGRSRIGTPKELGTAWIIFNCDRSSGRSRIGTRRISMMRSIVNIAIVLRGDRGLELLEYRLPSGPSIAIVLRGDRGLELDLISEAGQAIDCDRSSGRSRIGTIYLNSNKMRRFIAIVLRGDRGLELPTPNLSPTANPIAIVLRGDRGLEPRREWLSARV